MNGRNPSLEERQKFRKYLVAALAVLLLVLGTFYFNTFQCGMKTTSAPERISVVGGRSVYDEAAPREINTEHSNIQDVTLTELPVEDPQAESADPELRKTESFLKILTEPLSALVARHKSFVYEGEISSTLPTINRNAQDKEKRYGQGEKLESRFTFRKDAFGNFHLRQTSSCSAEKCKYNEAPYNGDLYYVDGTYYFVGVSGKKTEAEELARIVARLGEDGMEPLARRNWVRALRDLRLVIRFKETKASEKNSLVVFEPANPDMQAKTTELTGLKGEAVIGGAPPAMVSGSVDASIVLHERWMSGAKAHYRISLKMSGMGSVAPILRP